jgi:hypothetical protein
MLFLLVVATLASSAVRAEQPPEPSAPTLRPVGYLPLVAHSPLASPDLRVTAIEITQGVQNTTNSVPLVTGRATMVRVFTAATPAVPVPGIIVTVSGTRGGVALPGSPLRAGPLPVGPEALRGDLGASFNVPLPADWLAGAVTLSATVDATAAVAEPDEHNNTLSQTFSFTPVPPLDVRLVPITYTHIANGQTYSAATRDPVSGHLLRTFPVSAVRVSNRAPVPFTGDLRSSSEWSRLLDLITTVKLADGAPAGQVYYALVPAGTGSSRWFTSGVAGIGWIGLRAAASLEFGPGEEERTARVAAHEIGHTLRRYHAPCGTAGDPRQPFPYDGGSIGPETIGLDLAAGRVWRPDAPDNTRDIMGYCAPQWASDFTYIGLLEEQRRAGALQVADATPGLLLRATLTGDRLVQLRPVYAVTSPPHGLAEESGYAVELLDAASVVVARHPVASFEAEAPHPHDQAPQTGHVHAAASPQHGIYAVVPLLDQEVATVRLVASNRVAASGANNMDQIVLAEMVLVANAERVQAASSERATLVINASTLTLSWSPADRPALVRFTEDGRTWSTLGIDLIGGSFSVNRASLPPAGRFEIVPAGGNAPMVVELP